jgi:hypothetical protein
MTHHLGGASAFREALIRAVLVATLLIAGGVIAGVPTRWAVSAAHVTHLSHVFARATGNE